VLEIKDLTITLRRSGGVLLDRFSFTLQKGDRAVLIGEEGNGKSTLLKTVYDRALTADYCDVEGQILKRGKAAYLSQLMEEELFSLPAEEYFDGLPYYEHMDTLTALGVSTELLFSSRPLGSFSGGERVRLRLCRALLTEPDFLLLDEPTNDLDIPTLEWLERFLLTAGLPTLYISHDETLIENTANVIIHLERLLHKTQNRVTVTRAPYREYLERRGRQFSHQEQMAFKEREDYDKQMRRWRQIHDRVEHEQRAISRGDPHGGRLLKKKMHSVQATGRRLERAAESFTDFPHRETAILTRFEDSAALSAGKTVLDFSLPALTAPERLLARDVRLTVRGGEIVGIAGKNGAGKSTLLRLLWEELRARRDITAAYMPQDYAETLPYAATPLEYLAPQGDRETRMLVHNRLASMRFTYEEMHSPIARLSGGQRAKLLFLDMVLRKANVLLLDEPTRNFSPLSAPVVRAALRDFPGSIVSVSHDRKYLDEVCHSVYELTPEGLKKR